MRNKGKRALLALLLLGALLLLSGCVQGDLSIVGVEPGQPGPESGQLRILFGMNIGNPPSPTMTIDDVSLSNVSFTITNEDTNEPTVVTNPTIDQDPAISYARFDGQGNMIKHQLGILIPYTLKPGRYRVTYVQGDVLYPSADGVVNRSLSVNTSYNTSFTIAAPTPTPAPTPAPDPEIQMRGSTVYTENMAQENLILHIGEGISGFDASFFKSVSIDGGLLSSVDYDVENGSILLTIHTNYLNQLKPGSHTVSVALQGGAYNGRVLTAEIRVNPKPNPSNLPQTGDGAAPMRWLALCAGCAAAALLLKKRRA